MSAALAAHMPREAGKLALAEFMRVAVRDRHRRPRPTERESLLAGARSRSCRQRPSSPPSGRAPIAGRRPATAIPCWARCWPTATSCAGWWAKGPWAGSTRATTPASASGWPSRFPRHGERRKSELLQRFRLEAQAASQIRHPNIADVTDCGTTPDGRFFFVMEFVDGIDLGHLVRQEGPLPVERALLIAVQVCRALEAAHKAGIIHRDLKPSNVMLLRDRAHEDARLRQGAGLRGGQVPARRRRPSTAAELTQVDAAVGTPKYMAPEQIERGNDIDFRVDIYAVGGLLYFMLSGGHAPIEGDTVENVWRKKVTEEATPAAPAGVRTCPRTVEALVMRCLAREPGRRPVSMEVLRKELLAAIERLRHVSSSVLAKAPSSTSLVEERAERRAQRRQPRRHGADAGHGRRPWWADWPCWWIGPPTRARPRRWWPPNGRSPRRRHRHHRPRRRAHHAGDTGSGAGGARRPGGAPPTGPGPRHRHRRRRRAAGGGDPSPGDRP